jgi:hypothetical protein
MKSRASSLLRLSMRLSPGLLLLLGLCLGLGATVRSAHAGTSITVNTCDEVHLDAAITQANSDNAGDTITFSCSGDIPLTNALTISGSMTLDGSGQSVTLDGGHSVQGLQVRSLGRLTLKALTVANGQASTASNTTGGGISNAGTLSISNSTLNGNAASNDGGGIYNPGTLRTSVRSSGSIVAENSAPQGNDCFGTSTDKGYNLESGTDCGFTGTGSLQNVSNAQLALSALANNGGPTQTRALQQGSVAIDRIPKVKCPATDQRGEPRPDAGENKCDLGAYESNL